MVEFGKVLEKSVKMHIKYFIAFANPDLQSLTNVWWGELAHSWAINV